MAWCIVLIKSERPKLNIENLSFKRSFQNGNVLVMENFDGRFLKDKIYIADKDKILIIDGVILNKNELLNEYKVDTFELWINKQFNESVMSIPHHMRGPFTGCAYDFSNKTFVAFANQTGDTAIFYYSGADFIIASSDYNTIHAFCNHNNIGLTFNEVAANHILSLGFVVEGNTFAKEIRRTEPGGLIYTIDNQNELHIKDYHRFDKNNILDIGIDEAIEQLDNEFTKAVRRCFDKDVEYGYSHLADMSAGLDCRMTTVVAKKLGYDNITNICYAKSGTDEYKYASAVATYLGNEFIFKQLDDLCFLFDLEEVVLKNYGLAIYTGITGGNKLLSDINFDKFGLEHTGQLGDVILSSYCKTPEDIIPTLEGQTYSDIVKPYLQHSETFRDKELLLMYYRGFLGVLSTHFTRRIYTEAVSPFVDVDFMQFCFNLPLTLRCAHVLYWKWLYKKYPDIAAMPSSTKDPRKVNNNMTFRKIVIKILGKNKRKVARLLIKVGAGKNIQSTNEMNPFYYWYYSSKKLRDFMDNYYATYIVKLDAYPKTQRDIKRLFNAERVDEKALALTVLAAYSVYFD